MSGNNDAYNTIPGNERNEDLPPKRKPPKGFGVRHTQTLILFISLTVGFTMRAQLSVSMVAMIDNTPEEHVMCNLTMHLTNDDIKENNVTEEVRHTLSCKHDENINLRGWTVYRTYNWHKATQEMIVSSFFVGYTTMMLPMGLIAQKFGGKLPIMVALAVNGVVSIVTPWVPLFGDWIGVCACRLLQGITQAAFYPSIHTILGKWAPLSERGRLSTYVYTGSQFGTVLSFQISGAFAGNPIFGWPATFWFCGVLSFVSFGLLAWLGAATPHEHPTITSEELSYIMEDGNADVVPKKRRTPWKHILTSMAVWGLIAAQSGSAAGYLLVLTQTPTYMSSVLGVDIKRNGLYSSLPYIAMYVMALIFGFLSDFMVNRKIMSVANIRRTGNSIGLVLSGLFFIAFSYVNSTLLAVILLIIALGLHSGVHVGFHINQIDLAPNFAGPIMALGNMIGNLIGLLVPVIVSNIIKDDMGNQQRWQIVFLILAAFQFITNIIFVIFVQGKVQPWNFYGDDVNDRPVEEIKLFENKNKKMNNGNKQANT